MKCNNAKLNCVLNQEIDNNIYQKSGHNILTLTEATYLELGAYLTSKGTRKWREVDIYNIKQEHVTDR